MHVSKTNLSCFLPRFRLMKPPNEGISQASTIKKVWSKYQQRRSIRRGGKKNRNKGEKKGERRRMKKVSNCERFNRCKIAFEWRNLGGMRKTTKAGEEGRKIEAQEKQKFFPWGRRKRECMASARAFVGRRFLGPLMGRRLFCIRILRLNTTRPDPLQICFWMELFLCFPFLLLSFFFFFFLG